MRKAVVEWSAGLTLSKAIVQAEYAGLGDPRIILLHRQGQTHTIQTSQLLRGTQDVVLEAGDVIDLVP